MNALLGDSCDHGACDRLLVGRQQLLQLLGLVAGGRLGWRGLGLLVVLGWRGLGLLGGLGRWRVSCRWWLARDVVAHV